VSSLDLFARAGGLRAQRSPFVLATVVRAERPTSAKPGDRAVILPDGTIEGFVGGACAESTVRTQSLQLLRTGESTLLRITPTSAGDRPAIDGITVVDNPCLSGGTVDIFLEAVVPAPLVHVFGDTPIARALAEVGAAAGYAVATSTDPTSPIPPDATAVVVASHGQDEESVMRAAVRADVPYVALVASRKRGAAVLAELDLPADLAGRVRSPAGLDIGARRPGDVALSILAEIVQVRAAEPPVAEVASAPAMRQLKVVDLATALDPVCGMRVAVSPASFHLEHGGRTWYFCAAGCRAAFVADPARYGG
jgi:xanthine dehydrogenase accessory factor